MFFANNIDAQQSFYLAYLESITEGRRLSFPSFAFVEPIMKEIYLIDSKGIIIYTSDLFPIFTLTKRNGIDAYLGLTVDAEGNMYVAQGSTKENPR